MSAAMTALEFERPDGQISKMIVRQPGEGTLQRNPQAAANEFKLLQIMHALGLATPAPYYLDQAGQIFGAPALAIEYIEGKPEFALAHIADFTQQMATQLAKLHRVDRAKLDLAFL
ncbi:MAG: phosphotransferase, partial [Chloroflexi bacterium]|nr:phosphotransferase [Chloroflexota bacterium]